MLHIQLKVKFQPRQTMMNTTSMPTEKPLLDNTNLNVLILIPLDFKINRTFFMVNLF